jgi:carboxyl-terminal processing protease
MERLILDLRNNGGGLLDQAIEVSDQFVPPGSPIVETRGRVRDSMQAFDAAGRHPDFGLPLVVLVNAGTASAAEIVSGAIQDHDIGLVVGTPTWGKGLVQTVYNLSYGAGLALTTAKYYTPSGRLIQRDYESFYDYYARTDVADGPEAEARRERVEAEQYSTDLGRTVYGGGGITPDVEIDNQDLPPGLQYLLARAAFFRFAVEYADRHPEIGRDWSPDDAVLTEFRAWLDAEELETAEQAEKMLAEADNREFTLRQLRAEVLGSKFGIEAAHQVLTEGDEQIQKALELFPQASVLLAQRRELAKSPDLRTAESLRN